MSRKNVMSEIQKDSKPVCSSMNYQKWNDQEHLLRIIPI